MIHNIHQIIYTRIFEVDDFKYDEYWENQLGFLKNNKCPSVSCPTFSQNQQNQF